MKQGLLIIDMQNDYFKGGKYELSEPEKAAGEAVKILTYFREKGLPIFHVCHVNTSRNAPFFAMHSAGVDFYERVYPGDDEAVVEKHYPDSFMGTDLKQKLQEEEVTELVVCGMMTHMCVDTTVRSAVKEGYQVTLIEDACTTRDLVWQGETLPVKEVQKVFMASLQDAFAKVVKGEEWLKDQIK